MYRKSASSNTSRLEAHVGLFRLLMKLVSCLSYLGPKQNKLHISRLLWDKIEFYRGLKMIRYDDCVLIFRHFYLFYSFTKP